LNLADLFLKGNPMRVQSILFAALWCAGFVGLQVGECHAAGNDPCAAEKKAVAEAKANYEAAQAARKAAWDAVDVIEERIGVLEGLRNKSANAEAQAKNRWLGACSQYNACVSRPRNNSCESEKAAMDKATADLNACLHDRLKWEGELDGARQQLESANEALDKALSDYLAALNALSEAERALAGCRRMA
jgi:hypothetical protein